MISSNKDNWGDNKINNHNKINNTYCWNSMFMDEGEETAIVSKAVTDKTIVVPLTDGLEVEFGA